VRYLNLLGTYWYQFEYITYLYTGPGRSFPWEAILTMI
jgi:hypothetical protein